MYEKFSLELIFHFAVASAVEPLLYCMRLDTSLTPGSLEPHGQHQERASLIRVLHKGLPEGLR